MLYYYLRSIAPNLFSRPTNDNRPLKDDTP